MNNPICTGWYLTLILCSHLHAITSLPSSSNNDVKQLKEINEDSTKHDDSLALGKDSAKRGWKDNTMQVWGKRSERLNEPNSKLSSTSEAEIERYNKLMHNEQIKRKWGQNNMPVWGKRNSIEAMKLSDSEVLGHNELEMDKRKWGSNSMTVWGKRSDAHDESLNEYNKRKWGENSMTVWGKRSMNPLQYSPPDILESKRKWGDNTMSVWGKRSLSDSDLISLQSENRLSSQNLVGGDIETPVKRKWSDNTMQVWGKRKSAESNSQQSRHSVSKRSLRRFEDEAANILWRSLAAENENSDNAFVLPKRNWETNTMRVWGKRSQPRSSALELDDGFQKGVGYIPAWYPVRLSGFQEPEKRAWSSDNELRVWG